MILVMGLENTEGESSAPSKHQPHNSGWGTRNNLAKNTLAGAFDAENIDCWCNGEHRSHWHKTLGQKSDIHACGTGELDSSQEIHVHCTGGWCNARHTESLA